MLDISKGSPNGFDFRGEGALLSRRRNINRLHVLFGDSIMPDVEVVRHGISAVPKYIILP
jgi:hypothetical protein